jgi:hypothetical protein
MFDLVFENSRVGPSGIASLYILPPNGRFYSADFSSFLLEYLGGEGGMKGSGQSMYQSRLQN